MKRHFIASLVALAVVLPATLLSLDPLPFVQDGAAQDELTVRRYVLKSGKAIRAAVLGSDGTRVRLEVRVAGGSGTSWYELADFEDRSQVALRRALASEEDLSAQLAVAEFAAELGLVDDSRKQLSRVAQLADDVEGGVPEPVTRRAVDLIDRLIALLCEQGKVGDARHAVSRLVTKDGGALTDADKARFVATLDAGVSRQREAEEQARRAKRDAQAAAALEKKLAPIEKKVEDGEALRRKGLLGSKKRGAARKDFDKAIAQFERAFKDIDRLAKSAGDDRDLIQELDSLQGHAIAVWQDTLLARASLDLSQGRFIDAMANVNTILADDPKNKDALAMRSRIEVAENDWGWWR